MAIRTKSKDLFVQVDPISFTADLEVLSGNPVQTYSKTDAEFKPDRSLTNCVLMPSVSVVDPEGVMQGKQTITRCDWYEGKTRITDNGDYKISAPNTPKWSLSVKKNVDPDHPIEIRCVFTITDTRKGESVKFERGLSFYTAMYDSMMLNLKLTDQPRSWTIDPLREIADSQGRWMHNVTAQLYSGEQLVGDNHAAYWWQIYDYTTKAWRDISSQEYGTKVFGKDAHGQWTKQLQFDARYFKKVAFRCVAAQYESVRPSAPNETSLVDETTINVEFPKSLRVDIVQLGGAKMNSQMNNETKFICKIFDNQGRIPSSKEDLFNVVWKAKSGEPGSLEKQIGTGYILRFTPSDYSFNPSYGVSVYAEVQSYDVTTLSENGVSVMNFV